MPSGIHVEVTVGDPTVCQVAPQSDGDGTVTSVTRIPHPEEEATLEEFTLTTGDRGIEPDGGVAPLSDPAEQVFAAGSETVARFARPCRQGCVCERIEAHGCPVRDVTAVDGTLRVRFVATDHDTLQTVLDRLTDAYDDVCVNRLLRSSRDTDTDQHTLVDLGVLTDRQREILSAAHELGYFDHPKTASAADVAKTLDIAPSTFTEHVAAAQRNLLEEVLKR
jgi:predicted DNA binding protein